MSLAANPQRSLILSATPHSHVRSGKFRGALVAAGVMVADAVLYVSGELGISWYLFAGIAVLLLAAVSVIVTLAFALSTDSDKAKAE